MSLEKAHNLLAWPAPGKILKPKGLGSRVLVSQAKKKLGEALSRLPGGSGVRVGLLVREETDSSNSSLAIVCDFPTVVAEETLREAHRLAWNFCRTPLLLTLDQVCLRAWSCCVPPLSAPIHNRHPAELVDAELRWQVQTPEDSISKLHWVMLASTQFFQRFRGKFHTEGRADQLLLENLRFIRNKLDSLDLSREISHDLLGRVIFMQFLSQRRDSSGKAALNAGVFRRLREDGILSAQYEHIPELLHNRGDTYALFRWLNDKFNGDLFPGKGATHQERESEWESEISKVKQEHLDQLADFISGDIDMGPGQRCLFPLYSFDAIPLEFISSIYEEFVSTDATSVGAHYTPGHLVDFILDSMLAWESKKWNVKVLDPSCGSGIFLVKAYQRLIFRWKNAHPEQPIAPSVLRQLLEQNLFGVDSNPLAVRVASFSLYLAMCDEIDPKHYWTHVKFPKLRNVTIYEGDLFGKGGSQLAGSSFDVIVGNAPWGRNTATSKSKVWAAEKNWPLTYNSIGPLFLPRAVEFANSNATISMLQPLGLIMNRVANAARFRRKLFKSFKVERIVNLAALRFGLFKKAVAPACIATLSPGLPNGVQITYVCPKPSRTTFDDYEIGIDPYDVQSLSSEEAANNEWVWSVLMWGGRRDLGLIGKLAKASTLMEFKHKKIADVRQGIIRGDRQRVNRRILNRPVLSDIPDSTFLELALSDLPINQDPKTHSRDSQDLAPFQLPQLIVKQGWRKGISRFQAVLIRGVPGTPGALCSKSYFSVHLPSTYENVLQSACLTVNSAIAVYFLLLTSARFASYRPEANVDDLLKVPLPAPRDNLLAGLASLEDVDARLVENFELKDSERALIDDVMRFTLPDFKGDHRSPGRSATTRESDSGDIEPDLGGYCKWFLRILKAAFGQSKQVAATIYRDPESAFLPFRLVGIHLDAINSDIHLAQGENSLEELARRSFEFRRIARLYELGQGGIPTIYIIKPDQIRYWTPSMACRDADEVALDIIEWASQRRQLTIKPHAKARA